MREQGERLELSLQIQSRAIARNSNVPVVAPITYIDNVHQSRRHGTGCPESKRIGDADQRGRAFKAGRVQSPRGNPLTTVMPERVGRLHRVPPAPKPQVPRRIHT